ncbi:MAG: hypothetical protein MRY32_06240 [Rickettsiales bacterium]|nr:hypothetical protein [Rickettsiales bacterium]
MRYIAVFLTLCLTACLNNGGNNNNNAPAYTRSTSGVLKPIYQAKIDLDLQRKNQAIEHIKTANSRAKYFTKKGYKQSDLLVELTYLSHGTVSKLYIPSTHGKQRFNETEDVLDTLAKSKIKPLEYRLVTFNRSTTSNTITHHLDKALVALNQSGIDDVSRLTIQADRELDHIYRKMRIGNYTGDAKNRLEFHTQASEIFLKHNSFDIARDALKQANTALSDLRIQNHDDPLISQYASRLESIDDAIDKKDPSLLTKIGQTIDGWMDRGN